MFFSWLWKTLVDSNNNSLDRNLAQGQCYEHDGVTLNVPSGRLKAKSREDSKPWDGSYNDSIALKFDMRLLSITANVSLKFQSDLNCLNPNVAGSSLHEIWRWDVRRFSR